MSKAAIKVRVIEIPENFLGKDYEEDAEFRKNLKSWIEDIWKEKDIFLKQYENINPQKIT